MRDSETFTCATFTVALISIETTTHKRPISVVTYRIGVALVCFGARAFINICNERQAVKTTNEEVHEQCNTTYL